MAECGNRATPPPSSISRRAAFLNTQMGLGHERFDPALNASASDFRMSESNHRQFYRRRAQLMAADNWTQMPSRDAKCGSRACMTTSSARWSSSLYREARLLDERRFHEWLELFTDNARYWMGGRSNRFQNRARPLQSSTRTGRSKTTGPRRTNWPSLTRPGRRSRGALHVLIPAWPGPRTRRGARAS